jgi:hypothetical protein
VELGKASVEWGFAWLHAFKRLRHPLRASGYSGWPVPSSAAYSYPSF